MDYKPYNPLDKANLGVSVADALLQRTLASLTPAGKFMGAGIYAIYYTGDFSAYSPIRIIDQSTNQIPIYVGKAVPAGARKGGFSLDQPTGLDLYKRLREHSRSINEARNLNLKDFLCRYLIVDDIWIPLGESLLIEMFSPLWNKVVDGFGNHSPGSGRYNQKRSNWDVLHPGRAWAEKCRPSNETQESLIDTIKITLMKGI